MKRRNLPDLDSALADFEAFLNSDQKKKEKPLLDKAHETQEQIRLEGRLLLIFDSFLIDWALYELLGAYMQMILPFASQTAFQALSIEAKHPLFLLDE